MPQPTRQNKQNSWILEPDLRDAHERSIQNWENEGGVFHGLAEKLPVIASPAPSVH